LQSSVIRRRSDPVRRCTVAVGRMTEKVTLLDVQFTAAPSRRRAVSSRPAHRIKK